MAKIIGGVTTTPIAPDTIKEKITDQTYSPDSENAQSGKALAPVFNNYLSLSGGTVNGAITIQRDSYPGFTLKNTTVNGEFAVTEADDGTAVLQNHSDVSGANNYSALYIKPAEEGINNVLQIGTGLNDEWQGATVLHSKNFTDYVTPNSIGAVVDQTYNHDSANAQSGKAVAEAIGNLNNQYELIEKIIVGYSILTSKPEDWASNFTAYYKNTGTLREPIYTALTEFEEWESGKYYSYSAEDVQLGWITKEPDGKDFCFKGIIFDCTFTAASSNRNFEYTIRSQANTSMICCLYSNTVINGIKTSNSWYQCCFESMNGGIWTGVQNLNYTIQPLISREIPEYEPMRALTFGYIPIPAGSTITIYGVRA